MYTARTWQVFKSNIQKPIAVILIVNTLANTIGATFAGAQFDSLFGTKWIALFSVVFSLAIIQWAEILPKTLGVRYNRKIALASTFSLKALLRIFNPLISVIQFINRPFERTRDKTLHADVIGDIHALAHFAAISNMISPQQEQMLSRIANLSRIRVKDIMISREEIKHLSTSMSLSEALIEAHIHHHTRLPLVKENNLDTVIGYVNFKDLVSVLQTNPSNPTLEGIAKPMPVVSEEETAAELLNRLSKSYQHMAIVRDAGGRVSGLVTIEDSVEAVVGEINDEYDMLPSHLYQIAENRYIAGGGLRLNVLKQRTGLVVPDIPRPLGEWLIRLLGHLPKTEDKVTFGEIHFVVRKTRRSDIHEVIIDTPAVKTPVK